MQRYTDINRIFMNFVAALRTTHCQRTEGGCSIKPSHIYLQGRYKITQILHHIDKWYHLLTHLDKKNLALEKGDNATSGLRKVHLIFYQSVA